jgi:hypothetical protein
MPIPAIIFAVVIAVVLGTYWLLLVRPEEEQQRHL